MYFPTTALHGTTRRFYNPAHDVRGHGPPLRPSTPLPRPRRPTRSVGPGDCEPSHVEPSADGRGAALHRLPHAGDAPAPRPGRERAAARRNGVRLRGHRRVWGTPRRPLSAGCAGVDPPDGHDDVRIAPGNERLARDGPVRGRLGAGGPHRAPPGRVRGAVGGHLRRLCGHRGAGAGERDAGVGPTAGAAAATAANRSFSRWTGTSRALVVPAVWGRLQRVLRVYGAARLRAVPGERARRQRDRHGQPRLRRVCARYCFVSLVAPGGIGGRRRVAGRGAGQSHPRGHLGRGLD